jgi:glutathione S-transferase
MNEFVIHSIPGSPYGRAVLLALEEKSARYRLDPVAPGMFKTPEHLARHPFGRVPVLDHGDFRLYETQAILRYIDRVLPQPALTPTDPRVAGRMDQLMNINDWYLFQGVASVIGFQRVVGPRLMGLTPNEKAIAGAMPQAHTVFAELARQLGGDAFFTGDSISLADLILAPQMDFFSQTPEWEPLTADKPNLRSWLDRMSARPSMRATTWERVAALAKAA